MVAVLNDRALSNALASTLACEAQPAGLVELLERHPNDRSSTFESEVVTCRLADGRELKLLCKYERFRHSNIRDHGSWGHRRGDGYEAEVYRRVLRPLGAAAPRFFGVYRDDETGTTCLFLEYLDGAQHPEGASTLPQAVTWLARFHRDAEPFAFNGEAVFLSRYDRSYYSGWAERTATFAEPFREQYPWVADVCAQFAKRGAPTLEREPTVIHGEYYRKNLLMRGEQIYAIDWESCAIGAGEIDVAMLAEGWSKEQVDDIERQYARQRWPGGPPENFAHRFALAQVYVHFRWLGDQREWTPFETWRFEELRAASARAGLLARE